MLAANQGLQPARCTRLPLRLPSLPGTRPRARPAPITAQATSRRTLQRSESSSARRGAASQQQPRPQGPRQQQAPPRHLDEHGGDSVASLLASLDEFEWDGDFQSYLSSLDLEETGTGNRRKQGQPAAAAAALPALRHRAAEADVPQRTSAPADAAPSQQQAGGAPQQQQQQLQESEQQQQQQQAQRGGLLGAITSRIQAINANPAWPRVRGLILLNALVILVATNWVLVKDSGGPTFDPFTFATLRFAIAAAAFAPFLPRAARDPQILEGGLELGFWSALGYMFQALGLITTDASRASFISTFTVLVVPLLAGLGGQRIKALTWASAAAAVVGVSLLENSGTPPCIGDAWSLLSAVAFGIQVYRTEAVSRRLPSGATLPLMSVIMGVIAVMSAGASVVGNPGGAAHLLDHPAGLWAELTSGAFPWKSILFTGLLSTDVALWIEVIALHDVSSTDAAIIYTLEPVLGAFFAYVLLGERWGAAGWVGAGLIVASSLATQIMGGTEPAPAPAEAAEAAEGAPSGGTKEREQ